MICQQWLMLSAYKRQVYKLIRSGRLKWRTGQPSPSVAFLITMTKRFKSINHVTRNVHSQCSWWDLGDKATFERLSLTFELAAKPEGALDFC